MEDDALLLARELGKEIERCDLCGNPVPAGSLDTADPEMVLPEGEDVRVCPRCKQDLAAGALPLDAISGDAGEDDLE